MDRRLLLLVAALGTPATAQTAPKPGEVKTFGDWSVACDNVRRCAMASLGPADGGDWPELSIQAARGAAAGAGWEIQLFTQRDASPRPVAFVIDGKRFPFDGDQLAGPGAAAIVAALPDAHSLSVMGARGGPLGRYSAKGLSATLRYIDAQQGRAGTVTAVVAKGAQPADTVPAAPAAPVVPALALGKGPALATAQLAQMRRLAECDLPEDAGIGPETATSGDAILVILPCSSGAYNVSGALFVVGGGKVAPAALDAPAGFDATGAGENAAVKSVVNGTFDGDRLSSYAKGRGLGDCGVAQSFAWDGARWRLVEQSEMRECRGNPDFLRTWTARATGR